MRWRYLIKVVGILIFFVGLAMIFSLGVGIIYADKSVGPLLKSMNITLGAGLLLYLCSGGEKAEHITPREGMAAVAIGWTAAGLFGALPFYLTGGEFRTFVDAFFESISGFTTTGSSVLSNIEAMPRGILFWRSLIQWLGGMGIIVLSLAILPFLGVGGMQLYKAEVPSPVPDKLRPRIRETAVVLWKVYAGISAGQVILLMIGGMDLYDSLCHTFTTMPTGGFSTRNISVASYNSIYLDMVIVIFMIIAGINFSLHYQILKGDTLAFWKDAECRFFLGTVLVFTLAVSFNIYGTVYQTAGDSLRFGLFQIVSIITTTGFATADYEKWPDMSRMILLLCMFIGGSAGSTGGGMKCLRIMLAFKYCYKELFSMIHPHAVTHIKIGRKTVPEDVIRSVLGFLSLYMMIYAFCAVLLAWMGVDLVTSFGAVAGTLGNIGPGFGTVGPAGNFAHIPEAAKWLLIWCMLLGRLEIYTVIILLVPEFWRK
ncbi:MAG: potassium transporter [Desulfobacteraceae bacterium IS3]|nr:MAG: potassium transporter [Desulfobacteraceae bacterium IS3]